MSKYWDLDSPLMNGLGKIGDIIILNIVFVICCLPVVTIGAAVTSLYTVTMQLARNEYPTVTREFFKAFRRNFKTGTLCWLIVAAIGVFFWMDFRLIGSFSTTMEAVARVALGAALLVYFIVVLWLFPYIARFENTVAGSLRNAFMLSVIHLPFTLLLGGMTLGILMIIFFTSRTFVIATILCSFFGFAAFAYVQSMIYKKVFAAYEPQQ